MQLKESEIMTVEEWCAEHDDWEEPTPEQLEDLLKNQPWRRYCRCYDDGNCTYINPYVNDTLIERLKEFRKEHPNECLMDRAQRKEGEGWEYLMCDGWSPLVPFIEIFPELPDPYEWFLGYHEDETKYPARIAKLEWVDEGDDDDGTE